MKMQLLLWIKEELINILPDLTSLHNLTSLLYTPDHQVFSVILKIVSLLFTILHSVTLSVLKLKIIFSII